MILGHQRLQQTIANGFAPSRTLSESSPHGIRGHQDPRTVSDANENNTYKLTYVALFSKFVTIKDKLGVSVIMRSLIIFTVRLAIQHRF